MLTDKLKKAPVPKFPIGYAVNIGYLGLYRPDEKATTRDGTELPASRVCGIQLCCDVEYDNTLTWSVIYQFVRESYGTIRPIIDRYTELELLDKGYVPPTKPPAVGVVCKCRESGAFCPAHGTKTPGERVQ